MAAVETIVYSVPQAVSAGSAVPIQRFAHRALYFSGTFTATLKVEISPDWPAPVTWFEVASVTNKSIVTLDTPARWLRVNVTAYTSGVPELKIVGFDPV